METWDYIMLFLLAFAIFVLVFGIDLCKESGREDFNERKMRHRCYITAAVALLYLACRYFS